MNTQMVTRRVVLGWLGVKEESLTPEAKLHLASHMDDPICVTDPSDNSLPASKLCLLTGWQVAPNGMVALRATYGCDN